MVLTLLPCLSHPMKSRPSFCSLRAKEAPTWQNIATAKIGKSGEAMGNKHEKTWDNEYLNVKRW